MQLFLEFRHLSLHDLPISIPESVNCLFYIPHHKIRIPLRHTVAYKWLEISPLYPGRVLKFIDHHRMQSLTYFLKYNHRILISYILMDFQADGWKRDQPVLFKILIRSEEHTSELQSRGHLVCRLLLEKKKELSSKQHNNHTK